jgi:hypothetical protein
VSVGLSPAAARRAESARKIESLRARTVESDAESYAWALRTADMGTIEESRALSVKSDVVSV